MTPSRWARRTDASQREIISTLQRLGYSVLDLSRVGGGVPDLLIAKAGVNTLVEVKTAGTYYGRKLRGNQQAWSQLWNAPVVVLRSAEDALAWALTGQTPDSTAA